jgi:hypothetical protein
VPAHHSFAAEFDASKAIRVTGTLAKVEWTNPHIYFYVDVDRRQGHGRALGVRVGAPGALSRRGFKRSLLKLGDTLIVDGYQAKNGANLMDARRVTLPTGRFCRARRPATEVRSERARAACGVCVALGRVSLQGRERPINWTTPKAEGRRPRGWPNGKPDLSATGKARPLTKPGGEHRPRTCLV